MREENSVLNGEVTLLKGKLNKQSSDADDILTHKQREISQKVERVNGRVLFAAESSTHINSKRVTGAVAVTSHAFISPHASFARIKRNRALSGHSHSRFPGDACEWKWRKRKKKSDETTC